MLRYAEHFVVGTTDRCF